MKKSKILSFLFVSALIILLNGCGKISAYQKSIYNDDEKIARQADSYSTLTHIKNNNGKNTEIKYSSFNGMISEWSITSKGKGTITIDFNSQVDKGKFKAVFITPDKKVINLFEGNQKGSKTIETQDGTYRVKIVGDGASGKLDMAINTENPGVSINSLH